MTTSPTPDDIATKCSKCGGPFEMGQAFQGHETATWHSICPPNPDSNSKDDWPEVEITEPKSKNPSPSQGLLKATSSDTLSQDARFKLRDRLTAIKHQRDYHLMDEPEYIDEILNILSQEIRKELEGLQVVHEAGPFYSVIIEERIAHWKEQ